MSRSNSVQGVVIGIGNEWGMPAALAAIRLERVFGVPFEVLIARPPAMPASLHPSWAKLWALEIFPKATHVIAADADLLPVRGPIQLRPTDFAAALDDDNGSTRNESVAFGIPPGRYFNAGLFMASRSMQGVLVAARERGPRYGSWLEQTALNVAVHEAGVPWQVLPKSMNWLCPPGSCPARARDQGAHIVHFTGRRGRAAEVSQEIERHAAKIKPLAAA